MCVWYQDILYKLYQDILYSWSMAVVSMTIENWDSLFFRANLRRGRVFPPRESSRCLFARGSESTAFPSSVSTRLRMGSSSYCMAGPPGLDRLVAILVQTCFPCFSCTVRKMGNVQSLLSGSRDPGRSVPRWQNRRPTIRRIYVTNAFERCSRKENSTPPSWGMGCRRRRYRPCCR